MNDSIIQDFTNGILNESMINIVACTRKKIWASGPSVPALVQAKDAFTGPMFKQARECMEGIQGILGEPPLWYVFSSCYGIISPDWNLPDYSSYFGGPASLGQSVSMETLETQWHDLNLSRYDLMVLWGPAEYVRRIRNLSSRHSSHFIKLIAPAEGLRSGAAVKELRLFKEMVLRELDNIYGDRLRIHLPVQKDK